MLDVDRIDVFYGESHIIKDLSLHVDEGEIVSLLGRNGAGKTTTLRSIAGLHPPRSGTITFKGTSIVNTNPEKIHRLGMGFVPEEKRLFPTLTVEENLIVGLDKNQSKEAFEPMFEFFPVLGERLQQQAKSLSGGEQQMLAIARALVSEPDLLLIDEPTEGLMPQLVTELFETITQINDERDTTILIVDQNIESLLERSHRTYVLTDGKIVHEAQSSELSADDPVIQENLVV